MRRFTRLTNAFSKKLENHIAAISLHFMYYNFVRIHQTLRMTPAMAAGIVSSPWEVSDIVKLLDGERAKRGYSAGGRIRLSRMSGRTTLTVRRWANRLIRLPR